MINNNRTLELNADYLPIRVTTATRAFTLFYKGNAIILENHQELFGLANDLEIFKPSIIVSTGNKNGSRTMFESAKCTRPNVFKRDDFTCVYCGHRDKTEKSLSVDHVIPQSKGGDDSWENLVTACVPCNREKDDLTLEEYGKKIPVPRRPHATMLLKTISDIPDAWKPYLLLV